MRTIIYFLILFSFQVVYAEDPPSNSTEEADRLFHQLDLPEDLRSRFRQSVVSDEGRRSFLGLLAHQWSQLEFRHHIESKEKLEKLKNDLVNALSFIPDGILFFPEPDYFENHRRARLSEVESLVQGFLEIIKHMSRFSEARENQTHYDARTLNYIAILKEARNYTGENAKTYPEHFDQARHLREHLPLIMNEGDYNIVHGEQLEDLLRNYLNACKKALANIPRGSQDIPHPGDWLDR